MIASAKFSHRNITNFIRERESASSILSYFKILVGISLHFEALLVSRFLIRAPTLLTFLKVRV